MSATRITRAPGRPNPRTRGFWLKACAGVSVPLLAAGWLAASRPPLLQLPTAAPASPKRPSDDALSLRVQQAIDTDPQLGRLSLNLLVNVLDGVAVVGGPVPQDDVRRQIEAVVSAVPGVSRAKVTVWVPAAAKADPFPQMVADRTNQRTNADRPAVVRPAITLSVPNTDSTEARLPAGGMLNPVTSAGRNSDRVVPGAEPPPYPTIPPTMLPTVPVPEDRAWAAAPHPPGRRSNPIDTLRREPRFAALTVELSDGTAVIGGRARRHADAWEFADVVRSLPEVNRVVVGRIDVR